MAVSINTTAGGRGPARYLFVCVVLDICSVSFCDLCQSQHDLYKDDSESDKKLIKDVCMYAASV